MPIRTWVSLLLLVNALALFAACDRGGAPQAALITWESPRAPYALTLPAGWQAFNPETLKNGADFAANQGDRIAMVLATQVPKAPHETTAPDPQVERYAEVSVAQLERDVPGFKRLAQEATTLDERAAVALTADGELGLRPSRYMIAYGGCPGWRVQLVTWAHRDHAEELAEDFEALRSSWRFKCEPSPALKPDAGQSPQSD